MTFNDFSDEAKLLFVIGVTLAQNDSLTNDEWFRQKYAVWKAATLLGWPEFCSAYEQVANWIQSPTL